MTDLLRILPLPVAATAAFAAGLAVISPTPALACDAQPLIGSVCMTAASYCPQGYYEANGLVLSAGDDQTLFSLFGHTFDVDNTNQSKFQIPDLRGRSPVGVGNEKGLSPVAIGQRRGVNTQTTLSVAQMAGHTHTGTVKASSQSITVTPALAVSTSAGTAPVPSATNATMATMASGGNVWASNLDNPVNVQGVSATVGGGYSGGTVTNATTGGANGTAAPFTTVGPGLGIRFCIAGGKGGDSVWPQRPNN